MRSTESAGLDATFAKSSETAEGSDELRASSAAAADEDAADRASAHELIDCLLALGASWPGVEESRRRLVQAAAAHGTLRRRQGEGEDVVFDDFTRLRATMWSRIRRLNLPAGEASRMIVALDAAISLAVAAALRGYYRDVIERSGEWPETLERLVWEWRHHAHPPGV